MSELYAATNNETTYNLYNKRINYSLRVLGEGNNNVVDFNFGENLYYGRVGLNMAPIIVDKSRLTSLSYTSDEGQELQLLNFVNDIFSEMARQFTKSVMLKKIKSDDPYLSELRVFRAYQSPKVGYQNHQQRYFKTIKKYILDNNKYFSNFEEFLEILMPFLRHMVTRVPFTLPGYVKSRSCSVLESGLAVEIADLDHTNDDEKISAFINSPNWEFYVNACNTYGFRIDANIPWRIVMDIGSLEVHPYSARYGLPSRSAILTKAYRSASMEGWVKFVQNLLDLYNFCRQERFFLTEECNGAIVSTEIKTVEYTLQKLLSRTRSRKSFLKLYLYLRLYEEQPNMREEDMSSLVRDTIALCQTRKSYRPLVLYFESIINKEFDKPGSLHYRINKVDLEAFDEEANEEQPLIGEQLYDERAMDIASTRSDPDFFEDDESF